MVLTITTAQADMGVVTGIATGEAMITIKAATGWTVAMVLMEVRIMEAAVGAMAVMIAAQAAVVTTTTAQAAVVVAVEVTVNITVNNNIKVIEVINIKLINDNVRMDRL